MKKLRIAVWHNLPSGGGKRQVYNHVKGLVQRGHYVEAWCPSTADQDFLPLKDIITEHVIPLEGDPAEYRNPLRPYHVTKRLLRNMEEHCRRCAAEMEEGNFDVLFANSCMFFRTTPIANFVTIPSAIYLGEPYRWFYEAMPELPWITPKTFCRDDFSLFQIKEYLKNIILTSSIRLQARAELEYAKGFDVILANSIYSRECILKTYDLDSKVCYLGIDTSFYKPTREKKEDFVIGLGSIYRGKGIDRAIRAIAAMHSGNRPRLIWVGNFATQRDLNTYTELAKRSNVDFTPIIQASDTEVISLLGRARAILYTSRLEPFGLAPLEANGCCTPAVAIAEGGVRETIKDGVNGFLALNDDPTVLAGLLQKVLDDSRGGNTMGETAREHVKANWCMKTCIDNIENSLTDLLENNVAKKVLQEKLLKELKPTNDVRLHVEEKEIKSAKLVMSGWAFIDDGRGMSNSQIYVVVRNGETFAAFKTEVVKRPDVTDYFATNCNYDDSGFYLSSTVQRSHVPLGILITRGEKYSYATL